MLMFILLISIFTTSMASPTAQFYGSYPDENSWANQDVELSRLGTVSDLKFGECLCETRIWRIILKRKKQYFL